MSDDDFSPHDAGGVFDPASNLNDIAKDIFWNVPIVDIRDEGLKGLKGRGRHWSDDFDFGFEGFEKGNEDNEIQGIIDRYNGDGEGPGTFEGGPFESPRGQFDDGLGIYSADPPKTPAQTPSQQIAAAVTAQTAQTPVWVGIAVINNDTGALERFWWHQDSQGNQDSPTSTNPPRNWDWNGPRHQAGSLKGVGIWTPNPMDERPVGMPTRKELQGRFGRTGSLRPRYRSDEADGFGGESRSGGGLTRQEFESAIAIQISGGVTDPAPYSDAAGRAGVVGRITPQRPATDDPIP